MAQSELSRLQEKYDQLQNDFVVVSAIAGAASASTLWFFFFYILPGLSK